MVYVLWPVRKTIISRNGSGDLSLCYFGIDNADALDILTDKKWNCLIFLHVDTCGKVIEVKCCWSE